MGNSFRTPLSIFTSASECGRFYAIVCVCLCAFRFVRIFLCCFFPFLCAYRNSLAARIYCAVIAAFSCFASNEIINLSSTAAFAFWPLYLMRFSILLHYALCGLFVGTAVLSLTAIGLICYPAHTSSDRMVVSLALIVSRALNKVGDMTIALVWHGELQVALLFKVIFRVFMKRRCTKYKAATLLGRPANLTEYGNYFSADSWDIFGIFRLLKKKINNVT